jgi:hypothetical protein
LKFNENTVSASVNGIEVVSVNNSKYSQGLAGIGSDFNTAEFDNLK